MTLLLLSLTTLTTLTIPQTSTAAEDKPTAVNISGTAGNYLISVEHESGNTTAYSGDIYKVAGTSLQNNKFISIPTDPGVLIGVKYGNISSSTPTFQPLTGTGYEAKTVGMVGDTSGGGTIFTLITVMLKNPASGNPSSSTDPVHLSVGREGVIFVTTSRANGNVETDIVTTSSNNYCVNSLAYLLSEKSQCLTDDLGSGQYEPATPLSAKLTDMKDIPGVKISGQYLNNSYISNLDMGTGYQLAHTDDDMIFAIKNKPAATESMVVQMPTTGAPEGISAVGLIAVTVGLLGLLPVTVRRRRI